MTELSNIVKVSKFFWGVIIRREVLEVGHVDRAHITVKDGELSHTVFHNATIYENRLEIYYNDQRYLGERYDTFTGNEINEHIITPPRHLITKIVQTLTGYSSGYVYEASE